jgi:hypothetical protein
VKGLRERRETPSLVASLRCLELALVWSENHVSHGGRLAGQPAKRKAPFLVLTHGQRDLLESIHAEVMVLARIAG